ncbi:MAG: hypothetical protein AABW80_05300 [Nanoarchaeota archaeon]
MMDIFDNKIVCRKCGVEMKKGFVKKNGFELRAVKCGECGESIIHPTDLSELEHFKNLRGKTFCVKLRVVGNSHAISIPKEIVEFMNSQKKHVEKEMDDMVRLFFDDFDTLKVRFGRDSGEDLR